jgi:mercuric ion transport protein
VISVELVFDKDCANVEMARLALSMAFAQVGLPAAWREWDRASPESPARVRSHGSPTILVNGRDVAETASPGGNCCRLYADEGGRLTGAPQVAAIEGALRKIVDRIDPGNQRGCSAVG